MRTLAAAFVCALGLAFGVPLVAAPAPLLDHGTNLNRAQCPAGRLVVNLTETVLNDVDSGVLGNNWAIDDMVRHIQVVQVGPGSFCATVKYEGLFTTVQGASPGGTGTVGDGVRGTFQGGYITNVFTGTLKANAQTRGNLGTFDYGCDLDAECPGYVSWTSQVFEVAGDVTDAWWGWVYHAGNNGTWVNAVTGNSGDITGS